MGKKLFWILLALLAVAVIVLSLTLPGKAAEAPKPAGENGAAPSAPEEAAAPAETPDPAMPLDQSPEEPAPAESGEASQEEEKIPEESPEQPEASPVVDPTTGIELDENELPIMAP